MAGLTCDLLFSYSNKKEYIGLLNFRNVLSLQAQRIFDATSSAPPNASGVPTIYTGAYTGIVVNGVDFGTGRIISFSTPTSTDITENGRHLWKQVVNVEIYETGYSGNFGPILSGFETAYTSTLQGLEEQFSFDISNDGDYQYSHSANVKCADSTVGVSGYIIAQNIASGLLASTPPFGYIDAVHSGFYNIAGRRLYTETVNIFGGSVTFEERFVIQSRDFLKHSVAFDNGFMNVSESVTLRHSGVSTVNGAMSDEFGINTRYTNAIGGAYTRCSSLYGTYAALIDSDAYSNSLNLQPVQINKIFDERAQEFSYTILYSNNPNLTPLGYAIEREQVISENSLGTVEVSENGSLSAYNFKDASLQTFLMSAVNNEMNNSSGRISVFYSLSNMKKQNESKAISSRGKKASYGIVFTSDPTFINDGTFLTKTFSIQDNTPIRTHSPYLIIGRDRPLMHSPGQTELGNIICSVTATLQRPNGYAPNTPYRPDGAIAQMFLEGLNHVLFTSSAKAPTDSFVSKVSYSYDSNLAVGVTVELQYLYPKIDNI